MIFLARIILSHEYYNIKCILFKNLDLNSPVSSLQLLPIQIAFVLNSYNIIGILIKYGANPNYESLDLFSPMFHSDSVWSEEMFNALLDHGTTIRDLKFYGNLARYASDGY